MSIEFSYGKPEADGELAPIRVDSGEYAGSVFTFDDVLINDDGDLEFSTRVKLAVRDGNIKEDPEEFDMPRFNEEVSKVVMLEVIKESTNGG